jgi:hypothetical protein
MGTGIEYMVENRKDQDLKSVFKLCCYHEPSLKLVSQILEPYLKNKGKKEFTDNLELQKDPRSI